MRRVAGTQSCASLKQNMTIDIRQEQPGDEEAIYQVTKDAFTGPPYAAGDEQDLVNRLRELGQLSLSLVALDGDEIVGQITFSPVTLSDGSGPWYGLGPVSVTPSRQSEGIGGQLIRAGLDEISKQGALGCVLTGNPVYYHRFGFELAPENVPENEPAEYFQLKLLAADCANGTFEFHAAFYETESGS